MNSLFRSREYFDEGFVEQLHTDDDQTMHGKVRRNELIRQQIRNFYLSKCKHDLENAPMFFVPATEIGKRKLLSLLTSFFSRKGRRCINELPRNHLWYRDHPKEQW